MNLTLKQDAIASLIIGLIVFGLMLAIADKFSNYYLDDEIQKSDNDMAVALMVIAITAGSGIFAGYLIGSASIRLIRLNMRRNNET